MKLQDLDRESGVVAHFLAHAGANVHIAALAFNPRYTVCHSNVIYIVCVHVQYIKLWLVDSLSEAYAQLFIHV